MEEKMDYRFDALRRLVQWCEDVSKIFGEAGVVGRQVYHPCDIVTFDADPRNGLVLIWRLNYYDRRESREGKFLPLQLEMSLWSDEGPNSQEVIKFLYTPRNDGPPWTLYIAEMINKFPAVRDFVVTGWARTCGTHALGIDAVDAAPKAYDLIRSLASFYTRLPAA